ncbi:MAG: transcriptional regulator [Planctomycetota bacterium]|jgi:DNA-binding MarR family transcriptional regulator
MAKPEDAPLDGQSLADLDKLVHEPARLTILALLSVVARADATFLLRQTGLTWGNLSAHLSKLEAAKYVDVAKTFVDKRPKTLLRITPTGRKAFRAYRRRMQDVLDSIPE